MKLIPFEEAKKIIQSKLVNTDGWTDLTRQNARYREILSEIGSLPTIDPISTIDEMIEEERGDGQNYTVYRLRKLKSKLLLTQK